MVLQQSLIASLVGVVIGYIAVQTGSILPPITFHVVHNTLGLATSRITGDLLSRWSVPRWLVQPPGAGDFIYQWPLIFIGLAASAVVFYGSSRLPHALTEEEQFEEARKVRSKIED